MMIFVTGGAGYIGSHTILELLNNGHDVVSIDNFVNSSIESLKRLEQITNKKIISYQGDIRDKNLLDEIFSRHHIDAVIHFASLKSVGESKLKPLEYYSNNVGGTLVLLECMKRYNINKMILSSSATVYGSNSIPPHTEDRRIGETTNPYGTSKFIIEIILSDYCDSDNNKSVIALRYFNPIGAHKSGMIGENPNGIPNNLVPYISKVAQNQLPVLNIYGNDYPTKDGTGVRDYIHVCDLAKGHVKALEYMFLNDVNYEAFNLGTGQGYSVLEIVKMFEIVTKKSIPVAICNRREGDVAESWASADLAHKKLSWKAEKNLKEMIEDVWRWQTNNPNGYKK
ncbi:UDP-glucose 4-epimerase GalE [Escherichia coli]